MTSTDNTDAKRSSKCMKGDQLEESGKGEAGRNGMTCLDHTLRSVDTECDGRISKQYRAMAVWSPT